MPTIEERIKEIEEEIKKTKYNKATESHIGILKAKMAKLQMEAESHKHSGGGSGFSVPKSGDATVAFVGYPNVGKSSLLNVVTGTESEVGNFAFTTLRVVPGTLKYKGAQIQILDLPGIIENAASGSGRGREVLSMVRAANMIILVTDNQCKGMDRIIEELRKAGIVVNRRRKNISMKKTSTGGIKVRKPKTVEMDDERIREMARQFKITNAEIYIREVVNDDDLIDFFMDMFFLLLFTTIPAFLSSSIILSIPLHWLSVTSIIMFAALTMLRTSLPLPEPVAAFSIIPGRSSIWIWAPLYFNVPGTTLRVVNAKLPTSLCVPVTTLRSELFPTLG